MRTELRNIQLVLSDEEIEQRMAAACEASSQLQKLETLKNEFLRDLRKKKADLQKTMRTSLNDVERGRVEREVRCEIRKNFEIGRVEYWFAGQMVDCRPMLEEDRQIDFVEAVP